MLLRKLLWIDCLGALFAGFLVLSLASRLAGLYGLPRDFLVCLGLANLAYGTYSLALAARSRRPVPLIAALAAANIAWAPFCFTSAIVLAGTASPYGLAHLILEGIYVGGLGVLEWKRRHQLAVAS